MHLALSLKQGSALTIVAAAIQQVVKTRLKLCVGPLDPQAELLKMHVLNAFPTTSTHSWKKQVLLLLCINGDWRNTEDIEYFVDKAVSLKDRAEIEHFRIMALQQVFASAKPTLWPRHRWTGSARAVDTILLMQCTHSLLSHAYTPSLLTWSLDL